MAKFENMTLSYTQIASIPFQTRKSASGSLLDALSRDLTPGQRVALFPSYVNQIYASGGVKDGDKAPPAEGWGGGSDVPPTVEKAGPPRPYGSGSYPNADGKYTGAPKMPAGRDSGKKYKENGSDQQKSLLAFANRWGIAPEAVAGVLSVESRVDPSARGGAGNNFYGVFQLQNTQIPALTDKAGFGRLTPDQYLKLSLDDQLKVMDEYYKGWKVEPKEFFTGDAKTDTAKMWALQLAPGNAASIDYNNPNAMISNTKQADIIRSDRGGVTVGSVLGSLERGNEFFVDAPLELVDTKATADPINDPQIVNNVEDAKDLIPEKMLDTPIKFGNGETLTYQEAGITKWSQLNELGGQAYAGGENDPNTAFLAAMFQDELGDKFGKKTAQNDLYHKDTPSLHTTGKKFDFTVNGDSTEAVETLKKNMLEKYGLEEGKDYKILDEYINPSARSTGGHIDVQLLDEGAIKIDNLRTKQAETYIAQQKPPEVENLALETVSGETATPVNSSDYSKIVFSNARIVDNEDGSKTISWNGLDGKEISQTIQPDTMTPDFNDKRGMIDLAARLHYNLPITGMVNDQYTGPVPEPYTEERKEASRVDHLARMSDETATPAAENTEPVATTTEPVATETATPEPKPHRISDIPGKGGYSAAAGGAEITDPSMIISEDGKKVTRVAETGPEKLSVMPRHKSSDVFQENQVLMQEARQEKDREEAAKPDIATIKSSQPMSDFGRSRETGQPIAISTVMPRITPSTNKAFADAKMVGRFNKADIDGDMGIVYIDRGYA